MAEDGTDDCPGTGDLTGRYVLRDDSLNFSSGSTLDLVEDGSFVREFVRDLESSRCYRTWLPVMRDGLRHIDLHRTLAQEDEMPTAVPGLVSTSFIVRAGFLEGDPLGEVYVNAVND